MKKYFTFFRMRFLTSLQYRTAAYAGIVTQIVWGAMEILIYVTFYQENQGSFPMEMQALSSYIWLQQGFLALYMTWFLEHDILNSISDGSIAYELCRPLSIYNMWFVRSMATRLSRAVLRCMPVLLIGALFPYPYGLSLPATLSAGILALLSMALGFINVVAFSMIIYITTFYTISAQGVRILLSSLVELLSGAVIPIPFLPDGIRQAVELLPFASMQNTPFRIYGGDIQGEALIRAMGLQIFWAAAMWIAGRLLIHKALSRVVAQGG